MAFLVLQAVALAAAAWTLLSLTWFATRMRDRLRTKRPAYPVLAPLDGLLLRQALTASPESSGCSCGGSAAGFHHSPRLCQPLRETV